MLKQNFWVSFFKKNFRVYLSSPNSADTGLSSLTNAEVTKDCVAFGVSATTVSKPAIQAFQLLNESTAVQVVVRLTPPFYIFKYS